MLLTISLYFLTKRLAHGYVYKHLLLRYNKTMTFFYLEWLEVFPLYMSCFGGIMTQANTYPSTHLTSDASF